MSVCGLSNRDEKEYLEETLISYSLGYTSANLKIHADALSKSIDDVKVLSECPDEDTEEDIGQRLFEQIKTMILSVDEIFTQILEKNIDFEKLVLSFIRRRNTIEIDLVNKVALLDDQLIALSESQNYR
jgi:hypothetical protein